MKRCQYKEKACSWHHRCHCVHDRFLFSASRRRGHYRGTENTPFCSDVLKQGKCPRFLESEKNSALRKLVGQVVVIQSRRLAEGLVVRLDVDRFGAYWNERGFQRCRPEDEDNFKVFKMSKVKI